MSRQFLLAAVLATLPAALAAQATHPFVGTWSIEYPGGARHANGEIVPLMVKGTLSVEAVGDSLVATLKTAATADIPERPPVRMATKLAAAPVVFVHKSQATLNMNGEESQRTAITTWTFTPDGNVLTGTLERAIEGIEMQMGGPQALKGTRSTT